MKKKYATLMHCYNIYTSEELRLKPSDINIVLSKKVIKKIRIILESLKKRRGGDNMKEKDLKMPMPAIKGMPPKKMPMMPKSKGK